MSKKHIVMQLFKAKRLDNNEWVIGYHIKDSDDNDYIALKVTGDQRNARLIEHHRVNPETMCVHYGAMDKNGNPIFTGDRLLGYMMNSAGHVRTPKQKPCEFLYDSYLFHDDGDFGTTKRMRTKVPDSYRYYCKLSETEIIGNIHD